MAEVATRTKVKVGTPKTGVSKKDLGYVALGLGALWYLSKGEEGGGGGGLGFLQLPTVGEMLEPDWLKDLKEWKWPDMPTPTVTLDPQGKGLDYSVIAKALEAWQNLLDKMNAKTKEGDVSTGIGGGGGGARKDVTTGKPSPYIFDPITKLWNMPTVRPIGGAGASKMIDPNAFINTVFGKKRGLPSSTKKWSMATMTGQRVSMTGAKPTNRVTSGGITTTYNPNRAPGTSAYTVTRS